MKAKIRISSKSMKELRDKFKELEQISKKELSNELTRFGMEARNRMIKEVKVDTGMLKGAIHFDSSTGKKVRLFADKDYAPYVEFGTGREYSGAELKKLGISERYAAQFKGKSQDRVHLKARPFFFNSVRIEMTNLYDRLDKKIKNLTK